MANVSNLENRLIQIIEQNEPVAIALTGEWGIGKTYFIYGMVFINTYSLF